MKETIIRLTSYQNQLKNRLSDKTVPAKHTSRPKEYRQFLERELHQVSHKIEALKVGLPAEAKK